MEEEKIVLTLEPEANQALAEAKAVAEKVDVAPAPLDSSSLSAEEIDMVINVGMLKSGKLDYIYNEIK